MARSRKKSNRRRAKSRRVHKRAKGGSNKLYPVMFSFPREKVVESIPEKAKLLSDLIPGKIETYIYNTEQDYYNEYRKSLFATTTKKYGWDCLRHYEIIANGCIPYFPGIEECPKNTLALFPKELTLKGNALYGRLSNKTIEQLTPDERSECTQLIQQYLEHMRAKMTTAKMAQYILDTSNNGKASSILFLSAKTYEDYLRCLTLHGFKQLFGAKCHDYPKIEHLYKTEGKDYTKHYGKGITYTNLLEQSAHDTASDATIEEDIKNKKYDIIIYGTSWHKNPAENNLYAAGKPYYDLVKAAYKPEEVILLCGHDIHECDYPNEINTGHHIFVREL